MANEHRGAPVLPCREEEQQGSHLSSTGVGMTCNIPVARSHLQSVSLASCSEQALHRSEEEPEQEEAECLAKQ